jgi:nicotinamide-nucleotide amidase
VAYSNEAKMRLLKVPVSVLESHGAVSPETAEAMAKGIQGISNTDIGLSVTGIAGPGGGTKEKPVGLVYLGCYYQGKSTIIKKVFTRERLWNKERSAFTALDLLRKTLLELGLDSP